MAALREDYGSKELSEQENLNSYKEQIKQHSVTICSMEERLNKAQKKSKTLQQENRWVGWFSFVHIVLSWHWNLHLVHKLGNSFLKLIFNHTIIDYWFDQIINLSRLSDLRKYNTIWGTIYLCISSISISTCSSLKQKIQELSSRPAPKKTPTPPAEPPKPKVIIEQVPTADVIGLQQTVATVRWGIWEWFSQMLSNYFACCCINVYTIILTLFYNPKDCQDLNMNIYQCQRGQITLQAVTTNEPCIHITCYAHNTNPEQTPKAWPF